MGFSLYLKIIRKYSSKFFTTEKSILFLAQEFNIPTKVWKILHIFL